MRKYLFAIFTLLILCTHSFGQDQTTQSGNSDTEMVNAIPESTEPAKEQIVPVPEPTEEIMSYYHSGNFLWIFSIVWTLLVSGLFLFTGLSARIRNLASKWTGGRWYFTLLLYFFLFMVLLYVINFGLNYYQGFAREQAYGLSNQTFSGWFGESLKTLVVLQIAGALFIWIPFLIIKKFPRRWWLYTGLASIPFFFLVLIVKPLYLDPLFDDFTSMKDKALEEKIFHIADRAGIEGGRIFEVNKSEKTNAANAYVTGFGNTKRIVLWDTTLEQLDDDQVLFVMAHEMGHYVLRHPPKMLFLFSLVVIFGLYLIHRVSGWMITKYQDKFGFTQLGDIAALPLLILLFTAFVFLSSPIFVGISRHFEHEADRFALEITQKNQPGASAFAILGQGNLINPRPGPLYVLWRAHHPTLGSRIDFCNSYSPWKTGQELKYGHLFK